MRSKLISLPAAAVVSLSGCCCNAFVVPGIPDRLQSSTIRSKRRIVVVIIASPKATENDNEGKEEDAISTQENDDAPIFNGDVSESKNKGPAMLSRVTFGVYEVFSYCLQAAGAFFFAGLLLNLSGFGYTIDMEHGLVIDEIQNIRNTVQFEMEIQREEREDVTKGVSSSSGAVGSKLLESSFETTSNVGTTTTLK